MTYADLDHSSNGPTKAQPPQDQMTYADLDHSSNGSAKAQPQQDQMTYADLDHVGSKGSIKGAPKDHARVEYSAVTSLH